MSHQHSPEHEACAMRTPHESKEGATTELKETPVGKVLQSKKDYCQLMGTLFKK